MISKNSVLIIVIIGFILPSVSFQLYTLIIATLLIIQNKFKFKFTLNSILIIFFLIITICHFLIHNHIEDFSESLRIIYILIIATASLNKSYNHKILLSIRFVSFTLFLSVLFQWIYSYSDFWNKFVGILYSENHYSSGLNKLAPRAMGYMSNIIEAGFLFFSSICVALYRLSNRQNKLDFFYLFLSLTGLLLTQSKTLILIGIISFVFYLIYNWKSNKLIIISVAMILFYLTDFFLDTFSQIERLKVDGIQTSSFEARKEVWRNMIDINLYNSNFFEKLFGVGRGSFAQIYGDITPDSDFFYILNQFGLFGILLSIIFLIININIIIKSRSIYYSLFIVLSIISSFFIDLFTSVKVLFMIFIMSNYFKDEGRICMRKL